MLMAPISESHPDDGLLAQLNSLGETVPALRPVTDSFGLMLSLRAARRAAAPGWRGPLPVLDAQRFCDGAWLLADTGFQDIPADLVGAAETLLPVARRAFPALAGELDALAAAFRDDPSMPRRILDVAAGNVSVDVPGVSPSVLRYIAAELPRPLRERQAQDLIALAEGLPWRHAVCPVCGGRPEFTWLRAGGSDAEHVQSYGGQRWLRCGVCSAAWRGKRVSCVACGNEEPADLVRYRLEDRPNERADACRACGTYSLCMDLSQSTVDVTYEVAVFSMLPLEVLVRKEGFRPLVEQPWAAGL